MYALTGSPAPSRPRGKPRKWRILTVEKRRFRRPAARGRHAGSRRSDARTESASAGTESASGSVAQGPRPRRRGLRRRSSPHRSASGPGPRPTWRTSGRRPVAPPEADPAGVEGSLAPRAGALPELAELVDEARTFAEAQRSEGTWRAYRRDWAAFGAWCAERDLEQLPAAAAAVALYVAERARTDHPSTIGRRLAAVAAAHQEAGYESPTRHPSVVAVVRGVRRRVGVAPRRQVSPAVTGELRRMVEGCGDRPIEVRDRALLLVGFAGAFRRSELSALDAGDVEETPEGLVVRIRRSKTDQEGAGREIGIPYGSDPATCPVRALRAWRELAGAEEGPLFRPVDRHGRIGAGRLRAADVALAVKRGALRAGLDPARYAGHSLRSGLATSAAAGGASERSIMAQTGHRSLPTVRRYIRRGGLFEDNAAARAGL